MQKLTKMNLVTNAVLTAVTRGENLFPSSNLSLAGLTYLTQPEAYVGKPTGYVVPGVAPLKMGETLDAPSRLKTYVNQLGSSIIGISFAFDRRHVENQLKAQFKNAGGTPYKDTKEYFENLDAHQARQIFYKVNENALKFHKETMEMKLKTSLTHREFREGMTLAWALANTDIQLCTKKLSIHDGLKWAANNPRNELLFEKLSGKGFDLTLKGKQALVRVNPALLDKDCSIVFNALRSEHHYKTHEFVLAL